MPEVFLRQRKFTYSACEQFFKNKKMYKTSKK